MSKVILGVIFLLVIWFLIRAILLGIGKLIGRGLRSISDVLLICVIGIGLWAFANPRESKTFMSDLWEYLFGPPPSDENKYDPHEDDREMIFGEKNIEI